MNDNSESKSRSYTVIGIALAMFLGALDQTIVATAMPKVVAELHGIERFTWVTTAYLLVSTLLIPIYGKLSDIMSRRILEIGSVVLFLIGSALCGISGEWGTLPILGDGMNQLILFRAVQGFGSAGLFALAFIIVSDLYPPRDRAKISGVFGAVFGLSSIFGPLVGGFLTDNAGSWLPGVSGWRWVFYVNVPIGAVALWFLVTKMPHYHPKDDTHEFDILSAALMLAGFAPLILALQLDKTQYPWGSFQVLGLLLVSTLFMSLWIVHSLKARHPILDLRLFANKVFTWSSVASFFFGGGFMAIIIFLPIYMVFAQGVSATGAGVSIIPLSMGVVLASTASGPLITKIGKYKGFMLFSAVVSIVSFYLMSTLTTDTPYWQVVLYMFIVGIGFGPAQSVFALASQNAVEPRKIGQATSAIQFNRQIGSVICAAVLGVVFNQTLADALPRHGIDVSKMPGGQSSSLGDGPAEIKSAIIAGFDDTIAKFDRLFTLRGADARTALDAILADPSLPAEYKDRLKAGTPSMQIDAAFEALVSDVARGDGRDLGRLLDADAQATGGGPGLGSSIPNAARDMLLRLAAAPAAVRASQLPAVKAEIDARKAAVEDAASAAASKAVHTALETAKTSVADKTVEGMKASFADGVGKVWYYGIFLMFALLVSVIMIPSLKLRGKTESRGDGEGRVSAVH
ncbi:MAG TPA: MDR family MFS transporter [Rectinemataceae bacterium]|nr:MDR family MFS transporter [Rectinemataceae bacterium]